MENLYAFKCFGEYYDGTKSYEISHKIFFQSSENLLTIHAEDVSEIQRRSSKEWDLAKIIKDLRETLYFLFILILFLIKIYLILRNYYLPIQS